MRLLSKVALGGSLASAATAGVLVAVGVFATSATLVVADPVARPAQADELAPFDSCADLLDWYVDRGVREVGPFGWEGEYGMYDDMRMPMAFAASPAGDAAALKGLSDNVQRSTNSLDSPDSGASSETGTNTQEAAVDEPDVAKTNGSLVVRIVGNRKLVLIDVAHGGPTVTRRLELPKDGFNSELLLIGDRVLVSQQTYQQGGRGIEPLAAMDLKYPGYARGNGTRLLDIDIADPTAPKVLSTQLYSGDLLSLRQYDDTIRLVTSTSRPDLKWTYPRKGVSRAEATRHNRELVRATTIEDWLPSQKTSGKKESLLDCDQVFHPQKWSGQHTVAVTTFGIDDPADASTVAVTADGQVVYSSATRLYVASIAFGDRDDTPMGDLVRRFRNTNQVRTDLHAFALDGDKTTYAGSGHVEGSVRDRWSLDEYDGKLRVAWSTMTRRGSTSNGISVFTETDGRLEQTGEVDGLGPDEDIQSVRWFDDLAIVVTFRQTDPLYTIDLSDADHPRKLGALKIPGYSGYLHPIGDDLLLGLGVAGDQDGNTRGAQAAVFDISDLTDPRRISKASFGINSWITALDDPRGFTWLPDSRTGAASVTDWMTGKSKLVAFDVGADGRLRTRTLAELNRDYQARTLELGEGRLAILDSHRLRVVDVG
jgi:hypothetical protein